MYHWWRKPCYVSQGRVCSDSNMLCISGTDLLWQQHAMYLRDGSALTATCYVSQGLTCSDSNMLCISGIDLLRQQHAMYLRYGSAPTATWYVSPGRVCSDSNMLCISGTGLLWQQHAMYLRDGSAPTATWYVSPGRVSSDSNMLCISGTDLLRQQHAMYLRDWPAVTATCYVSQGRICSDSNMIKKTACHTASQTTTLASDSNTHWLQTCNTYFSTLWWFSASVSLFKARYISAVPIAQIKQWQASQGSTLEIEIFRVQVFQLPRTCRLELSSHWS